MNNSEPQLDFVFYDHEKKQLIDFLSEIKINPYSNYYTFIHVIKMLTESDVVPIRFNTFCNSIKMESPILKPLILLKNCPVDVNVPIFDYEDPVNSKYQLKKTHITEGFLALYATLMGWPIIAHNSVNNGDFFHDIYPKNKLYDSQSQKTLETLKFHKDFTNHFVIPDYMNVVSVRDSSENEVYSTFVENKKVIQALSEQSQYILRQTLFNTPYDDISVKDGRLSGDAKEHAIINGEYGLKVFEGRTKGTTSQAQDALDELIERLHQYKISLTMQPGDFVSFHNHFILHGKEVIKINNIESLKQRWSMKTHNVSHLEKYSDFFIPGRYGVVNG